jgi:hypothetical protein
LPSSPPSVAETHHQLSPPLGDHLSSSGGHLSPLQEDHPPTLTLEEGFPLPPAPGEEHLPPSAPGEDHPPLAPGDDHPPHVTPRVSNPYD